jgi:putative acetyltransferase
MLKLTRTNSQHPDFILLIKQLDEGLQEINGDQHGFFSQFNKTDSIKNVVIAYMNDQAAGCGAFKRHATGAAEIKRMFVDPVLRGRGIGKDILKELETWAAESGFTHCVLETAKILKPAVNLYQNSGYEITPNYEPYVGVDTSVCMRKEVIKK